MPAQKNNPEAIEKTIKYRSNILIVAPHGVDGDDDNTGEIVRLAADKLQCSAVINEVYRKPKEGEVPDEKSKILNLNRLNQIKGTAAEKDFLKPIVEISTGLTNAHGKAIVVWVHGIGDDSVKEYKKKYEIGRNVNILRAGREKLDNVLSEKAAPIC